jgi:carbamoyltransferase
MNILGLSWLSHDASAALLRDGRPVAMAEEERFSRLKHDAAFPRRAIAFALATGGLASRDVDIVTIPHAPFLAMAPRLGYAADNIARDPLFALRTLRTEFGHWRGLDAAVRGQFARADLPLSPGCRIVRLEHHLCHAASAYLASPFDRAAILSWDGRGEWPSLMRATGHDGRIDVIDRSFPPHSLGQLYESFTRFLGFGDFGDEYKVMGLAPYGRPDFADDFRGLLGVVDGHPRIDPARWRYHAHQRASGDGYRILMADAIGGPRRSGEPLTDRHRAVAASLQQRMNEVGVEIATALRRATGATDLCLAGGVAQNIVMNREIFRAAGFERVFVQPASHDGGLSLGGALAAASAAGDMRERFVMTSTAWGAAFEPRVVEGELRACGLAYRKIDDPADAAASLLAAGRVVGWFQGRAEFGPRALGQRSILADPRRAETKDVVNAKIKFREEFRPFAPAVLAARFADYFEGAPANAFMTFAAGVRAERAADIPAVVHVDGTARPQAVEPATQPLFARLLSAFGRRTGLPVLLNTSFNVKGEPIVNAPTDAIRCFFSTGLDALILGDYVLTKPDATRPDAEG